jgi:CelD/BcsL family acetyltransferase involved in cellulose biosynthesis/glycosyltransferase involved in cell wall biosynthesis
MPLTILSVAYPFAPVGPDAVGGAEQVLSAIDDALVAAGHRSLVLACEGSRVRGQLFPFALPAGPLTAETRARAHAEYRARLEHLLRDHHVDVVHFHGIDFASYQPPLTPPALGTLHLPPAWYPPEVFAGTTHLHCVSAAQRRACPPGTSLLEDVPNGVDLARFRPAPRAGRSCALILGRICPEKGIHLGLEAARRAGVRALLGGQVFPYPEHQRYFDQEVRPRLDWRRRFVGRLGLARKARLLARARCLVVPSLVAETSSLVALEALASGTPVVAFRQGALPELIEHGVTGFLADSLDELVEGIRRAPALRRQDCRRAAEARFSVAPMCQRYLALYQRLAARPRLPARTRVEELRDAQALGRLRDEWQALWEGTARATIFQSPAWLLAYATHLFDGELRVLTFRQGARLVGLAPFFVWRDGETRMLSLLGAGHSDYQDLLLAPDSEVGCRAALGTWLADAKLWDRIEWSELVEGSPLLDPALATGRRDRVLPQEVCPALSLEAPDPVPPSMRKSVEYARRRARREAGLRVEEATAANLDRLLATLEALHAIRWPQRTAQAPVRAFHRQVAEQLLGQQRLLLFTVELAGEPAAVLQGFRDPGATRYYRGGFDPRFARFSPGLLAVGHAIDSAMACGSRLFDFLRGAEPYKYRWGARDRTRLHRRIIE